MQLENQILSVFKGRFKQAFERARPDYENLSEIRIRAGKPILMIGQNGEHTISEDEKLSAELANGMVPELKDLKEMVEAACGYSGYAFEEEIGRGYLTIPGGHRMGIAGRAVLKNGSVQTLKHISAVNLRISHSVTGCAEKWIKYLYKAGRPCHGLIISPPGCGKTTLLRDVVRLMSDGWGDYPGVTVGVVDERSEIAGTYRGIPSHDLGMRTDVLDGCPKLIGMEMLLRSMAPKVLAVDEIGITDVPSIENALRYGCRVVATLHGEKLQDYLEKPGFAALVRERVFERYVFLKQAQKAGSVSAVLGQNFEILWEENACT